MKGWLFRQIEAYLPSFIFCGLAVLAFYLSPDDAVVPPPQLETQVINAKVSRTSADGSRLLLQTEILTKRASGVIDFEKVQTQTHHGKGKVVLWGPVGVMDERRETLTIRDVGGEITADKLQATLSMQTATYYLIENRLTGTNAEWRKENGDVFFGNRFVMQKDGTIIADNGVRATFSEYNGGRGD